MSSLNSNQKCNSPKASAQALLARQFLEEHGWKVVENPKAIRVASSDVEVVSTSNCQIFSGTASVNSKSSDTSTNNLPNSINIEGTKDPSITTFPSQRSKRGISNTESNFSIVSDIQDLVCDVFTSTSNTNHASDNIEARESFKHTFVLPHLGLYPLEFQEFLHKELIETSTLVSLEQTGIWGFHDRRLTLRKALHDMLTTRQDKESFKRRWKHYQEMVNKQSGLIYNEKEWTEEWDNLVRLASPMPRSICDQQQSTNQPQQRESSVKSADIFYESLEELHVFVLAHVISRPIIIIADTILKDCNGEALAPISFGGIYLPLQISPHLCHRSPLVLSYDSAHFSALVPMSIKKSNEAERIDGCTDELADAIPLVDPQFELLPVHFVVDPTESVQMHGESTKSCSENFELPESRFLKYDAKSLSTISKYLDIQVIPIPSREVPVKVELAHSFSHLSLKLKSGSCNDIARFSLPAHSHSLSQKSSTLTSENSGNGEKLSSSYSESSKNGDVTEDGARTCASSSLTSSPMSKSRMKLPQVAQNVVKTFNSLGRSVKKKIRQSSNSSSPFKKAPSTERKNSSENKKPLRMSESLLRCDSFKRHSEGSKSSFFFSKAGKSLNKEAEGTCRDNEVGSVLERNSVLCAKLTHTKQPYQDEMMRNYLESALQRFQSLKQSKPACDYISALEPTTDCINYGCDGIATQETSYLCRDCFERHKREELEHERNNKSLIRKATVTTSSSVSPMSLNVSMEREVTVSSPSFSSPGDGLSSRKKSDALPPSKIKIKKRPISASGDDENFDENTNNNNNTCNVSDDFDTRTLHSSSPSSSSCLNNAPLRFSTTVNKTLSTINPSPFYPSSHKFLQSSPSSSPKERKSASNFSPPISCFSTALSTLGRVESGPKLPVFPGSPGKRVSACSPRHPRINGISSSNANASSVKARVALSSRGTMMPSAPIKNFSECNVIDMWSNKERIKLSPQQRRNLHLQQSLMHLQQQSLPRREPEHHDWSRRFGETMEQELYTMSQCIGKHADGRRGDFNCHGFEIGNGCPENRANGEEELNSPRDRMIGCQQFEF